MNELLYKIKIAYERVLVSCISYVRLHTPIFTGAVQSVITACMRMLRKVFAPVIFVYTAYIAAYVRTVMQVISDSINRVFARYTFVERLWNANTNRRTIVLVLLGASLVGYLEFGINAPPQDFPEGIIVTIQEGASLTEVAHLLEEKNIIRSALSLNILSRILGRSDSVYFGDYQFGTPVSLLETLSRITSGAFGLVPVTVVFPEGGTVKQYAVICEKKFIHCKEQKFIALAEQYEGYLAPDTYYILPTASESEIIQILRSTFFERIKPLSESISQSPYSLHEILTLASIVEKEESKIKDRKMIAGVIENRLKINMALQVDATFLYILGKGSAQLTRKDLAMDSPYNTYVNTGIPPGPIGNPSLSAIEAVLNPTDNPYIFYLADAYGNTYYSKTYEEHLAKKRLYIDNR
jgi:UPF0755 protein